MFKHVIVYMSYPAFHFDFISPFKISRETVVHGIISSPIITEKVYKVSRWVLLARWAQVMWMISLESRFDNPDSPTNQPLTTKNITAINLPGDQIASRVYRKGGREEKKQMPRARYAAPQYDDDARVPDLSNKQQECVYPH